MPSQLRLAVSHEFLELYRGDKDYRLPIEIAALRPDWSIGIFASRSSSPLDRTANHSLSGSVLTPPPLPSNVQRFSVPSIVVRRGVREAGGTFAIMPSFGRCLQGFQPDVILESPFTWLTPRSYQTFALCRRRSVPLIYQDPGDAVSYSSLIHRGLTRVERPVVQSVRKVITFTEHGRSRFIGKYGLSGDRIVVIPKPVDCRFWTNERAVSRREILAELGWPSDAFVVAYFGRLMALKGAPVLRSIASLALADERKRRWRFLYVGGVLGGSEDEQSYAVVPNSYVSGFVPQERARRLLGCADVIVFPNMQSLPGFPTALAESMSLGVPIVVGARTNHAGLPCELTRHMTFCAPGDEVSLRRALVALAGLSSEQRQSIGCAMQRDCRRLMDYSSIAAQYVDIIETEVRESRS